MNLQRRIPWIVAVLIVLAIVISACERPLTSEEDQGELPTPIIITSVAVSESVPDTETESVLDDDSMDEPPVEEAAEEVVEEPTVEVVEEPTEEATEEPVESEVEVEATQEPEESEEPAESSEEEVSEGDSEEVEEGSQEPEEEAESEEGDNGASEDGPDEADESASDPNEGEASEAEEPEDPAPATHTVAGGENLYRISLLYGISWVDLASYNNIVIPNSIYPGQVLLIPGADDNSTEEAPPPVPPTVPAPVPPPVEPPSEFTDYTVLPGDTLSLIGLRFGVSWVEIAEANGIINPNQIYSGQVLKIPVSTPGPSPEFTHVVLPGESLLSISLIYGIPWLSIASSNNIASPYFIQPGQTLVIPGG